MSMTPATPTPGEVLTQEYRQAVRDANSMTDDGRVAARPASPAPDKWEEDQGSLQPAASVPVAAEGQVPGQWRPIETAPIAASVLVYWPKEALNDDGELTGEHLPGYGHVSTSIRHSDSHGWETDSVVEANGDWFGDDFEFSQPTHWMPLPSAPVTGNPSASSVGMSAANEPNLLDALAAKEAANEAMRGLVQDLVQSLAPDQGETAHPAFRLAVQLQQALERANV